MIVLRGVETRMRDGAALVADVHLPASGAEGLPTILVRTTYGRQHIERSVDVARFTAAGYAIVAQDVRGRYDSDGEFYHGVAEVDDGHDTLEWIAAQSWSNGRVGMTGLSYLAAVQCAAACSGSSRLVSMFHVKAPFDYYRHGNRQDGAFHMYMLPITFYFASTSPEALRDPQLADSLRQALAEAPAWLRRLPLERGCNPLSATPSVERWLIDMTEREVYDDFWRAVPLWQPGEHLDRYGDVAGFYVGGWYDMYREDEFYTALAARQQRPVRLLMGPWTHLDFGSVAGDVDFGAEAALAHADYMSLQLEWFDETLAGGAQAPARARPPVRVFVMGGGSGRRTRAGRMHHGGRWRDEWEWPPARARELRLHLQAGGGLAMAAPAAGSEPTRFRYDPRDPAPTVGGSAYFVDGELPGAGPGEQRFHLFVPYGPHDQSGVGTRPDVMVFQTLPLDQDVEVTGPVRCTLWFSSSARDTDFIVRLIDVYPPSVDYPDGYAMNVTEGMLRARYRESFAAPVPLVPGRVERCQVELAATSNLFKRGHLLRLDITSSSYPAVDPNPNTGEPFGGPAPPVAAVNSIYHDAERPSVLALPVVPT